MALGWYKPVGEGGVGGLEPTGAEGAEEIGLVAVIWAYVSVGGLGYWCFERPRAALAVGAEALKGAKS